MRISRVQINNYRAIDKLDLSFIDSMGKTRPITVIAGPNGSGKTSLLFAMTNALRGVMSYRAEDVPIPTTDDIRLSANSHGTWTAQRPEVRVRLDLQFDENERRAIPELIQLVNMQPPPALPDGKLALTWTYPPRLRPDGTKRGLSFEPAPPYVTSWLMARGIAIKEWPKKTYGFRPDLLDSIGGIAFFPQDRNLRERVTGTPQRGDSSVDAAQQDLELMVAADPIDAESASASRAEDTRVGPRQKSVAEILHYLSDYTRGQSEPLPDERNWEKRIQESFHHVCSPKKYLGYLYREDDPWGAPVLEDDGRQYTLAQAASGEQVILEYITRLTYPRPLQHSIILIDEPEVHLHAAWVRQLYMALKALPGSNQFILTTHSAELRQRAAADNSLIDLGLLDQQK